MTYKPQHVANFFLDKADEDGIAVTQLKLIKLVYIAYAWYLALTGKRLFSEPIEAWQHGPVVESIYHEFKHFKKSKIVGRSVEVDFDDWETFTPHVPDSDKETNLILGKVWASYRRFSAWDLRNKTHEAGGPWHKVYKRGEEGIVLNDDDIQAHYIKKITLYLDQTTN